MGKEQVHLNIDSPSPKYWVVQLPVHLAGPDSDWPENKNYDKDPEFHLSSGKPAWDKSTRQEFKQTLNTEKAALGTLKVAAFIIKMLLDTMSFNR